MAKGTRTGKAAKRGRPAVSRTSTSSPTVEAVAVRPRAELGKLARLADQAEAFAGAARSSATVRAYSSDMRDFSAWCSLHQVDALPASPAALALYLTDQAGKVKTSTIQRRVSAISQAHKLAGLESPTADARVRSVLAGIRRTKGTAKAGKAPVSVEDLRAMSGALPSGPIGVRDRALLLIGFAGALRRSELVALDVEDVTETRDGLVLTIRRSKTDQEGAGQKVGLPYGSRLETCPVRAFRAWREVAGIKRGPVFRAVNRHGQVLPGRLSDKGVALVIKRAAALVDLKVEDLAGHSLRAGFVTSAAAAGAGERAIMGQTRHRSIAVMRSYIRDGSLFRENAAAVLGL